MDPQTFLDNFATIADAPNGFGELRKYIVNIAVSGLLDQSDQSEKQTAVESGIISPSDYLHPTKKNWHNLPLGICAEIFNGNATSTSEKLRLERSTTGRPFVATKDIRYGFESINYENGRRVPCDDSKYKVAPAHSVLICLEGGSAGKKMGIVDRKVSFGNKLFANVCKPWVNPRYLLIVFLSDAFGSQFRSLLHGIIGGVSKAKLMNVVIPVPPLDEQLRIVDKVDKLMALCDELEEKKKIRDDLRTAARASAIDAFSTASTPKELNAAWKRIHENWITIADTPESIASLRSLILDLAVHGKLNQLRGRSSYPRVMVESVLSLEYGKPLDKSLRSIKGAVPVYGANGIKAFTERPLVRDKGIVVGRKGSAGEINLTDGAFWPLDVTFFVKFDQLKFDLMFLYYLLKSLDLPTMARGIKPGINRNDVYKLEVIFPPLAEQKRIVAKVNELMALCDELEKSLKERESIVQKFAGSMKCGTAEVVA